MAVSWDASWRESFEPWRRHERVPTSPNASGFTPAFLRSSTSPMPFFLRTTRTRRLVLMCLTKKAGTTAWLAAMAMAHRFAHPARAAHPLLEKDLLGGITLSTNHDCRPAYLAWSRMGKPQNLASKQLLTLDPHCLRFPERYPQAGTISDDELARALTDPNTPQIMIVRDPYTRLLSGFLDKIAVGANHSHSNVLRSLKHMDRTRAAFATFIWETSRAKHLDAHFKLQTDYAACGMSDYRKPGVLRPFEFYLKYEEIDRWYAPLIRLLELEQAVSTGCNVSTPVWHGTQPCFVATNCDGTCEDVLQGLPAEEPCASRSKGPRPRLGGVSHSTGASNSSARLLASFYTRDTARVATRFLKQDLLELGYPTWQGPS